MRLSVVVVALGTFANLGILGGVDLAWMSGQNLTEKGPKTDHWEIKGGFVKGWFRRTYPRSGFRSGGTCERTLVPVFVPGEHPNVPSFRFLFRGTSAKSPLLENHPFGKPRIEKFKIALRD